MTRLRKRFMDCAGLTMEQAESYATGLIEQQRDVMFHLGDLARYCEARWPDQTQVWPVGVSPGLIARAAGVCKAYPTEEDRQEEATYSIYMRHAGMPDRLARVAASVAAGRTSDEERAAASVAAKQDKGPRWLLAIDCNYYLHRFWFSGAAVEAAVGVAQWVQRTVERLKEKGLTDVVCCFDSHTNNRKSLTADWEDKYKDRPPKDPELVQQLQLVRELLHGHGFCCYSFDGYEADDVMATCAKQFDGKVTLLSQDKDVRQCLSEKCNILLDVVWAEDETGESVPDYKWITAKTHLEAKGLTPSQWIDYQCLMGDTVDGIKGAIGIGEKGAADLVKQFGSVEKAIEAAELGHEDIKAKKREALIAFKEKLDVTRQLVTLVTDLELPTNTRI